MSPTSRSTSSFESIPVVDISSRHDDTLRADLAAELCTMCHEIGFFVVAGHGIDDRLVDDVFSLMETFFALDVSEKEHIDKRRSPHFRGWESVGSEFTNNRVDLREQIDIWSEYESVEDRETSSAGDEDVGAPYRRLLGPNQWMPDDVLAGQRELTLRWMDELAGVADEILELLALGLGLDPSFFRSFFGDRPMSLTKMIHYPPTPPGEAGVNPHHDTGFLTLLAPGPVAGLQVINPAGDWIDVPSLPGTFVVNLGEMLQAMTGNYFVATPHRVVAASERLSAAYFHGPSLDARLAPIDLDSRFSDAVAASPRHAAAGFMASAEETDAGVADMASGRRADTYGAQLWNYFARSYPENMALHHSDLA